MLAVPVGLLASAILVVNNVRDLETDRRAGKRTLAVRLGRERTRALFVAMVAGAFADRAAAVAARLAVAVAAAELARARRSPLPVVARRARRAPTGRRSTARWRAPGGSSSRSACCSRRVCLRAEPMAQHAR